MSPHPLSARPLPPARRGACPAFRAPMATGDGLILRLFPSEGALTIPQLRGLAAAAGAFGNGLMEVTARGSLQLRGLTEETVAPLQERVLALGIAPRLGLAVDVSPLSGLDPQETADARALARRIRDGAQALDGRLGPKVCVVVDGGGAVSLDGQKADVRLKAVRGEARAPGRATDALPRSDGTGRSPRVASGGPWSVTIGGGAPERLPEAAAAERAIAALTAIAALGRRARATDLPGCAADAFPAPAEPRAPLGPFALSDGTDAFSVGLPFGAGEAGLLAALADAAEAAGARDIRPAPGRVLLATGLAAQRAGSFAAAAERLGCLTRADDPRAFLAACPGAPACACAVFPARALAGEVAAALAPLLDGTVSVHLSACAKGCAHPAPATLTLVGIAGQTGMDVGVALVHDGAPSAATGRGRPVDALVGDLAALAAARRPGESGRALLDRLGIEALWAREGDPAGDFKRMIGT